MAISKNSLKKLALIALCILVMQCSPFNSAQKKVKQGKYVEAIDQLKKLAQESKQEHTKGKANFLIAESYRLSNQLSKAEEYYQKSMQNSHFQDNNALFFLALAQKSNGKYEEAKASFERFLKTKGDIKLLRRAKQEIENLQSISPATKENSYVTISNCSTVNSEGNDYSPMVNKTEVVFASTKGSKLDPADKIGFSDLFSATIDPGTNCLQDIQPLNNQINLEGFHEASPTFSKDGRVMIFARSNSGKKRDPNKDVDLYVSIKKNGEWAEPKPLKISTPNYWDASPMLSPDGKSLYFASNRPGGYGGIDLFRATKNRRGEWANVTNLGKSINTAGDEMFPYVSKDRKLYFASSGHPGLGGLDLFVAVRKDGETTIENLGKPYNSSSDDFGLIFIEDKKGFFCSNRVTNESKGGDDIYHFEDTTPELKHFEYYLSGTTYLEEGENNEVVLPNVSLKLLDESDAFIERAESDENGKFQFNAKLEIGPTYKVVGEKSTFLAHFSDFSTAGKEADQNQYLSYAKDTIDVVLKTKVVLQKNIFEGLNSKEVSEIELNHITYEFDKWDLTTEAMRELDKLIDYMKTNPDLKVELGSHTDSRGSNKYNMTLSEKRSNSAVDYIVSRGIDTERIQAKGYGETDLKFPNAKMEEEHEQNRRTTVRIIE